MNYGHKWEDFLDDEDINNLPIDMNKYVYYGNEGTGWKALELFIFPDFLIYPDFSMN